MAAETYRIVFKGEILPSKDIAVVKVSLAHIFSLKTPQVQALFSGKSVSVKRGLDPETAEKFRKAFERAGALVYVVPEIQAAPAPAPAETPAEADLGVDTTLRRHGPVPMICPNCGHEQQLAESCLNCGIDISEWERMRAQTHEAAAQRQAQ